MRTFGNTQRKGIRIIHRARAIAIAAVVVLSFVFTAFSWFFYGRAAAAVSGVSDPTAIFINAGNQEDIRYMYMSGIDVENGDSYKDFVFCVRGNNVISYRLQLAYTTNNQFEYELYPAQLAPGAVPNDAVGFSYYYTHPTSGNQVEQIYYAPDGTLPLAGHFLNRDTPDPYEILAYQSDSYYSRTYDDYPEYHKYAVPLYWQTDGLIYTTPDANNDFCDYYLLRVLWGPDARNDKETDIIYISARNTST